MYLIHLLFFPTFIQHRLEPTVLKIGKATIRLEEKRFDKKKHKFKMVGGSSRLIEMIDGRRAWGTDEKLPREEIKSFTIRLKGKLYRVPKALWSDCFNLGTDIGRFKVTESKDHSIIFIRKNAGDSAGSYVVEWKISFKNMKFSRKIKSTVI